MLISIVEICIFVLFLTIFDLSRECLCIYIIIPGLERLFQILQWCLSSKVIPDDLRARFHRPKLETIFHATAGQHTLRNNLI